MKKFEKLTAKEMQEVNGGLNSSFGCNIKNCPVGGSRPHGWHTIYAPTVDMIFPRFSKTFLRF